MMRVSSTDSLTEVMERIVDGGIAMDPWTSLFLRERESMGRYHWVVAENLVCTASPCDQRRAA